MPNRIQENFQVTVGGRSSRPMVTFTRPASATQYTAGDNVSTTGTTVPLDFSVSPRLRGIVTGATMIVTPASSNMVITAADFDLLLFRPDTDIPYATASYPADNAPITMTAAMYRNLIGIFSFTAGNWRNQLGAATAGTVGYQSTSNSSTRPYASFNFDNLSSGNIRGLIQAKSAWNPGNVANDFTVVLDIDLD